MIVTKKDCVSWRFDENFLEEDFEVTSFTPATQGRPDDGTMKQIFVSVRIYDGRTATICVTVN